MTTIVKKYFGTDGIRGPVGKSLVNAEFMLKLGWAVGKVLGKKDTTTVLIGKDTRVSGYMLESALQAGLSAAGADVYLLGPMPTPAIAYLTHSLRASAGIVISASHNSYEDNGVKFFDERGMKLSDELELAIEHQLEQPMRTAVSRKLGKAERLRDAPGRYIEFCKSTFPAKLSLAGLKLVVDCANGAAYKVAPAIFHELGADVVAIHNQPDGYNINRDCGATDVHSLQQAVIANQADLGIALDGDGDRLILVDAKAEIVDGDEILCMLAKERSSGIGCRTGVVGTVMSNLGLEQALQRHSVDFKRAAVGDRYVIEELVKQGWSLGGEASGHIVDLDYTTTGDGIVTALQILRILQMEKKSLHELKKVMTKCPQILVNVAAKAPKEVQNHKLVLQAVSKVEKELGQTGRVLLRASGTESCVRVMVEGEQEVVIKKAAEYLANTVREVIG